MEKVIIILVSVSFLFVSCKQDKKDVQSSPGTPASLQEKSSGEMSFSKKRQHENLVESLYAELLEKNPELDELEKAIENLNEQKQDSLEIFQLFDQKNTSYYTSAGEYADKIKDSLLRVKIKTIIGNSLDSYNHQIAATGHLIATLDAKDKNLEDLHNVLKLVKTLPLIEKYQAENTPSLNQIEKVIRHFDKAIQRADTLAWK